MKIHVFQKLNNINMVGGRRNLHESFLMKPGIPGFGASNLEHFNPPLSGTFSSIFLWDLLVPWKISGTSLKHWLYQIEVL
jgi:hypothetical protein